MKYKIYYSGILRYGYVTISLFGKPMSPTNKPATKFRFKFIAKIVCWILNKTDKNFITYTVYKTSQP